MRLVAPLLLALTLTPPPAAGGGGPSPLAELLSRHLEARGGRERLAAVTSARLRGTMFLGPGVASPFLLEWRRPDRVRVEVEVLGDSLVQAFDGETAWAQSGGEPPARLSEAAAAGMRRQADPLGGPLVDPAAAGHRLELLGRRQAPGGGEALAIAVALAGGDELVVFLDPRTWLQTAQTSAHRLGDDVVVRSTTAFSDYRPVDGLLLPFRVDTRLEDAPPGAEAQRLVVEEWQLDLPIPGERFAIPAAGAEPSFEPAGPEPEPPSPGAEGS